VSAVDELSEADMRALLDAAKPPRFNARQMADEILAKTPAAKGGGDLYIYRDGCFRPKGRLYLQREVAAKLGDKWKSRHSSEVVTLIEHTAQELWDTPDPDLIQLANGILDVTSGDLMPPTPDYLSPARLPIHHDSAAKCPAIDKALSDTLDPELRESFLELAGYLATADNSLQKAIMFLGSGANGKSVLLRLIRAYLGPSNVSNVALHRLDEDRFAAAELYGKHANIFSDLDAGALRADRVRLSRQPLDGGVSLGLGLQLGDALADRLNLGVRGGPLPDQVGLAGHVDGLGGPGRVQRHSQLIVGGDAGVHVAPQPLDHFTDGHEVTPFV